MQILVPPGMTHQQYVQTPAGQRDMQAMQNWFGGGELAMFSSPQLASQSLGGRPVQQYGQLGFGAAQPPAQPQGQTPGRPPGISMQPGMQPPATQPGRMYDTGMAQPIPTRNQGTAYNSGSRPIVPTPRPYRPTTTPQPMIPSPAYPTPPRNPNDAAGIAAWTQFYGTAPVFERMPTPRQTPYGFRPQDPRTTVTMRPGAGPGRGDRTPRRQENTWGSINPGVYGTDDDREYFVGSATDPGNEAWNAQQAQQAQQQHRQSVASNNQWNQMQQTSRAPATPRPRMDSVRRR